ncbi:mannose-specific lectin-like [Stegastes partitus]|uniref:Mannose-specific lectin-like n=1 Tax=Stegastes partitus TaxID=144197 RepID=A0A9Y4KGH0_9TELE|nr:PREDICTED: mannose-specific lectin-like [Stegastes partitus]
MSRNYLSANSELRQGDFLLSNNEKWKAVFQDDGNFVIYGPSPVWASGTDGAEAVRLCMQDDCNLVMYDTSNQVIWDTGSSTAPCITCRLQLTDDGTLVIYREAEVVWTSEFSKGNKK